jgi:AcrR family transcriptional regulator
MLSEMPVTAMSLNELSRRVGLAKSNVLRYFESREEILLQLLDQLARDFLAEAAATLPARIDQANPAKERAHQTASALASAFASREMLCELLSAQAGVLEHNVSPQAAARYKRGAHESLTGLASLLRKILPELGERQAAEAASAIIVLVGALWIHTHPADAVRAACAADPSLVFFDAPFTPALERSIAIFLIGLMAD